MRRHLARCLALIVVLPILCFSHRLNAAPTPFAQTAKLALKSAVPNRANVPRLALFELTLDLAATYNNPFDADEIDVYAVFTSPQKQTIRVNGFLSRDYKRQLVGENEQLQPTGAPQWKIRFAPPMAGNWTYRVWARDRNGTTSLPPARFAAIASSTSGYARTSRKNPRVFALEKEKPLFLVGENMGWPDSRGTFRYDEWLQSLGAARANWMRMWMDPNHQALEWTAAGKGEWRNGDYRGVGVYALDNAWKIDTILDAAAKNNIYVMLCLGTYGEFTEGGFFNEGMWKSNPYNAANGGPCATAADFWTNATARKLYRQRLRYITARYGWRTNMFAYEFWNEANAPAPWVGEMARYIKGQAEFARIEYSIGAADPYNHLVSTTYGNDAVWKIPQIDFTMSHSYGDTGSFPDHAPIVADDARQNAVYVKPHLMAEFGIDWRDSDAKYDPQGRAVNFHNGLWSSTMSGNAGGAMLWWWDNYVHPQKLYAPFTALRNFSDRVNWTSGAWGKAAQSEFVVTPSGIEGHPVVTAFLYSPGKAEMRTTPTFRVDYAQRGRFTVRVNEVSVSSRIQFLLDGKLAREITLDATPPSDPKIKPEYESTQLSPEWKTYRAHFNKEYSIDVPAGARTISLANVEGDWASLDSITLQNYRSSRYPNVDVYGSQQGRNAILWIQNADHNWKNVAAKTPIATIENMVLTVRNVPAGSYSVEWFDTWRGAVSRTETATSKNSALLLKVPPLSSDVAVRIVPR